MIKLLGLYLIIGIIWGFVFALYMVSDIPEETFKFKCTVFFSLWVINIFGWPWGMWYNLPHVWRGE